MNQETNYAYASVLDCRSYFPIQIVTQIVQQKTKLQNQKRGRRTWNARVVTCREKVDQYVKQAILGVNAYVHTRLGEQD